MKNKIFGNNLRALRMSQHLTQQEVADYCGVTLRAYSAWEREGVIPRSKERLIRLEELLDIDEHMLYDEDDERICFTSEASINKFYGVI